MTARAKAGCQACRVRHLKCDQKTPTCGRCESSGRECTRGYPYRYQQNKFGKDQKWVHTPKDLSFVDQTSEIVNGYDNDNDPDLSASDDDNQDEPSPSTSSLARPASSSTPSSQQQHNFLPITSPPTSSTPQSQSHSYGSSITLPPLHSITSFAPHYHHTHTNSGHEIYLPPPPSSHNHHHHHSASFSEPPPFSNPFSEDATLPSPAPSHHLGHTPTTNPIFAFENHHEGGDSPLTIPSIYLDKPVWPLKDPEEAMLLRHFVQKLAIWLDLCDPHQHFQVEVPKRAGTCPILLNAIFALSARHLAHTGSYDRYASPRYHQECLKYLIPMLGDHTTVADETLFAATIVLRVLEEIDMPASPLPAHTLGIQAFVSAHSSTPFPSSSNPHHPQPPSLGTASFWVGLRQEIYSAMMSHSPIALNLSAVDRGLSSHPGVGDFEWANRAVVFCADVVNCCFGSGGKRKEWEELKERGKGWKEGAPSSFEPIFWRERDGVKGEAFPEVWYSMACHIIGVQHHKLGEILLSIFDPSIPKVGAGRSIAVRKMEEEITNNLRSLCGIGLYNRWTPPGMFTASMGIAICGDRFTKRSDQEALLDVLIKTEQDHARPTALVQEQMKRSWGWEGDDG